MSGLCIGSCLLRQALTIYRLKWLVRRLRGNMLILIRKLEEADQAAHIYEERNAELAAALQEEREAATMRRRQLRQRDRVIAALEAERAHGPEYSPFVRILGKKEQ